jgi:capsular exopolysaccharide synthesis family protein
MVCVVLGISLFEFRCRRVGSVGEVVDGLGMKLVGTLPSVSSRNAAGQSPKSRREMDRRSILTESINATRTVLLHASRVHSFNVVMITSASKGEGKTTLSSQLSTSLALAGLRTVVVDCDLRSPSLHRVFDMSPAPGIAELLRGGAGRDEIIHPTAIPNLSMIPAGFADEGSIQSCALGEVRSLLSSLKREFDIVIVDSPPVLAVADSLLLSQYVDVVLFAILRGVSRVPRVFAAYERLSMLGTRILGAVMIGAEMHEKTYS